MSPDWPEVEFLTDYDSVVAHIEDDGTEGVTNLLTQSKVAITGITKIEGREARSFVIMRKEFVHDIGEDAAFHLAKKDIRARLAEMAA